MNFFNLKPTKSFGSFTPVGVDIPICKSVSHFNWFARYDVSNETDNLQDISKITSASGLSVNV